MVPQLKTMKLNDALGTLISKVEITFSTQFQYVFTLQNHISFGHSLPENSSREFENMEFKEYIKRLT